MHLISPHKLLFILLIILVPSDGKESFSVLFWTDLGHSILKSHTVPYVDYINNQRCQISQLWVSFFEAAVWKANHTISLLLYLRLPVFVDSREVDLKVWVITPAVRFAIKSSCCSLCASFINTNKEFASLILDDKKIHLKYSSLRMLISRAIHKVDQRQLCLSWI